MLNSYIETEKTLPFAFPQNILIRSTSPESLNSNIFK